MASIKEILEMPEVQSASYDKKREIVSEKLKQAGEDASLADNVLKGLGYERRGFAESPKGETFIRQDKPIRRFLSDMYTPILEGFGMVGAGAAAAPAAVASGPLAPVVEVGAGAAGFAGGRSVARRVDELTGLYSPEGVLKEAKRVGEDIKFGAGLSAGGAVAGKMVTWGGKKLFSPYADLLTPDRMKMVNAAKELDIPLTSAQQTGSKGLSLFEGVLRRIPGSAGVIQKYDFRQLEALVARREKMLAEGATPETIEQAGMKVKDILNKMFDDMKIANAAQRNTLADDVLKKLGSSETHESLGLQGVELLKKASEIARNKVTAAYENVGRLVPQGVDIQTPNLRSSAQQFLKREKSLPPKVQNKELVGFLEDLSGFRDIPPDLVENIMKNPKIYKIPSIGDWDTLSTVRSELRSRIVAHDFAAKSGEPGLKGMSDRAGGVFKQLKKALEEDMRVAAEQMGGDVWEAYQTANVLNRGYKSTYDIPFVRRIINAKPESITKMIYKPNDVTSIEMARKAFGDEAMVKLRSRFVQDLVEGAVDREGTFSGEMLGRNLNRYGDDMLERAIGKDSLRNLYRLSNNAIDLSKQQVGPDILRAIAKTSPEKVIDAVIKPKNTMNIKKVFNIIGPEAAESVRAKFAERLLTSENNYEIFSPMKFASSMRKYGPETLKTVFGEDGYIGLAKLRDAGLLARGAEVIGGNPSGTMQNLVAFEQGRLFLTDPIRGSKLFIVPGVLARAYTSPKVTRWLTKGFRIPVGSREATETFTRLVGIFGYENLREGEKAQRINETTK